MEWLGYEDSNLGIPVPKTGALPLGDTPMETSICWRNYRKIFLICQAILGYNAQLAKKEIFMPIQRAQVAIEEIKRGNMVVLIDDEDRENEGDIVFASTFSTPEYVNFMATHAKGLICVAVNPEIAKRLELEPMVSSNNSSYETAFTVSVDAADATTGISAGERDMTIKLLGSPLSSPDDLVRPGHIFPLIAKEGGTLVRTGHTEGSVDLCRLSGVIESAVICEIMKENGEMARRDDLELFAKEHNLKIVYISDIVEYRMRNESLVKELSSEVTEFFGVKVKKHTFVDHMNINHYAMVFYNAHSIENVKFHNIGSDFDLFTNHKRYSSLLESIEYLKQNGGVLVFINSHENHQAQMKEYGVGAQILKSLGVSQIRLISSSKGTEFVSLGGFGLEVVESIVLP